MRVATDAEGRTVRYIRLAREPVFIEGEFFGDMPGAARSWRTRTRRHPLTVLNHLHGLTRPRVILRELPFAEGDAFTREGAEEGMRNLRALGIFAMVRIAAVEVPGDPEGVGVLVYTRDLWSLRFESEAQGTAGNYRLLGQLTERNMFGWGKQGTLRFEARPDSFSVGELYYDYRLLGSRTELQESIDLVFNRGTGELEGEVAALYVGRPFYKLAQRWAYDVSVRDTRLVSRALGGDGSVLGAELDEAAAAAGVEGCSLASPTCVRQVFAFASTRAGIAGHRRFGHVLRHTLSVGGVVSDRRSRAIAETALLPGQSARFAEVVLPTPRRLVYPYLRHRFDTPRFGVFTDLGSYGVSENVQLGPWTDLSLGLPLAAFGSTDDGFIVGGDLGYRAQLGRGLVDGHAGAGARLEGTVWVDQRATAQLRGATPPWFFGRLVGFGRYEGRRRDTGRTLVALDSSDGLRGYPVGYFLRRGASRMFGSLEYRSLPWELSAIHVGGVAFYDGGSLFRRLRDARYHHSAGLGLRVLLPQLNRFVLRVDAGVAIDLPGFAVVASYGSAQAVPLTAAEDAALSSDIRGQ